MSSAAAIFEQGNAHFLEGRTEDAVASYRQALTLDPACVAVRYNLGVALQALQRYGEAEAMYRDVLAAQPGHAAALNNLALALRRQGRYGEALPVALQAVECAPRDSEALDNLGAALGDLGHWNEAAGCHQSALQLNPASAGTWNNLGVAYMSEGHLTAAKDAFRQALALAPEEADARLNLAHALLLNGEFAAGWDAYEARFYSPSGLIATGSRALPQPRWQGEALADKTLLVWAEQGLGDQILFAGLLPELSRRVAHIVVECDSRLVTLFQHSFPGMEIVPRQDPPLPPVLAADLQAPLGGLGRYFRASAADFPRQSGYLHADPAKVAVWKERLGTHEKLRVGLNWAGNPAFRNDRWRSAALADFAALGNMAGVEWFNLHQGARGCELDSAPFPIQNVAGEWAEVGDTAAFITNLDLVISTCTSIPHLAGALGQPVWVLTHGLPYWAWGRAGDASPWYPSARVFRQKRWGDWTEVMAEVARALEGITRNSS